MNSRHRGTLRTDFETDLARLDEFHVMESEGQRLMYKLICDCDGNTYRSADEGGENVMPHVGGSRADRIHRYCPQETVGLR